jgi:hypothetical protein
VNYLLGIALSLFVLSCSSDDVPIINRRRADVAYRSDTAGARPPAEITIPMHAREELVENSAAAVSDDQPGVVFTINDSDNAPMLFAIDTTGADRGAWFVDSARNVDWENASMGPCGVPNGARCVYIGDTGDNFAHRSSVTIYRVVEPRTAAAGSVGHLSAERVVFSYPDEPHDVEAMYVAPDTSVILITKRPLRDARGHPRPALVFRLPASAWRAKAPVVAQLIDSLPIVPGSAPWRLITDAALSPDARYLAVRTYAQVYVFATDSGTGRVNASVPPAVCNVYNAVDESGEGVGWLGTSRRLILTAEGRDSPLRIVTCPLPTLRR